MINYLGMELEIMNYLISKFRKWLEESITLVENLDEQVNFLKI